MKIENSPSAYGFLAGAFVLILGLIANASCAFPAPRSPEAALESTVLIEGECMLGTGYGSGVIVDNHTLLTAWHVVDDGADVCLYTAVMPGGKRYPLMRGRAIADADLAEMTSAIPFDPVYPVGFAPTPAYGEEVCVQTAFPRWAYDCGKRQVTSGDVFAFAVVIERGNSGSGVYDRNGRLVGIVTRLMYCNDSEQMCAGRAVSLWEHLDELR